jgi:hypothetical protein
MSSINITATLEQSDHDALMDLISEYRDEQVQALDDWNQQADTEEGVEQALRCMQALEVCDRLRDALTGEKVEPPAPATTRTSRTPVHAWIVPGALAVGERPGGGGRSYRVARFHHDMSYWQEQGVRTVVSCMRSRHNIINYAQQGFGVRWYPMKDLVQGRAEIRRMADEVATLMAREPGAVLVHVDRVSEWLAAAAAALRIRLGLADGTEQALEQVEADGFPVGDLARALLGD